MDKINKLTKQEIAREIQRLFPEKIISVTGVEVSRDLSFAKVWISTIEELDKTVKECQSEVLEIQRELAKKLILRRIPKLHFYADNSSREVAKIERLIKETKED